MVMASNFIGPDIHDSEIVRRYQQMLPPLKDKLEKAIRLYANMVRQHAECHEGDVFRLDTSEYSRQMADVIRHLDEMQLLLSTIASWGSLPAECLYGNAGVDLESGRPDLAPRQPDFNALEKEGRAQLERMLSVQAVLQKCRPAFLRKKDEPEEVEPMEQLKPDSAASDTMDTDEGQQQTTTTVTSGDDDEEEEEEEEERSGAATSQHDSITADDLALSPPAVVAGGNPVGTPLNPASVPVHSMQTPPPPPPPRPSTTSGRVSTPQHLHPIQPASVEGMTFRPKEELRSGPPSSEGVASDMKLEEGSADSPAGVAPAPGSLNFGAMMRAGSHSNSPAAPTEPLPGPEPAMSVGSMLQQQLAQRLPPQPFQQPLAPETQPGGLVTPKMEPTSVPLGGVKTEAMEQEEAQN